MARIEAICISQRKGEKKTPVPSARLLTDHGLENDAHAGSWHRQLSLLGAEDIASFCREKRPGLKPGDFAENLVVSGLDLSSLGLGSRLRLGAGAEISVTQIGKSCHSPCAISRQTGDCLMPRAGLFARVGKGDRIAVGDPIEILLAVGRNLYQAVVLTISDRCSRGEAPDTAGPAVGRLLAEKFPVHLYRTEIIPDEQELIAARFKHYADGHSIDLIVAVGGTGFSPRDVTPEAVAQVAHRLVPGLGEAMRAESLKRTPHAMLSRALCGIRNSTLIVSLPGSERAATENLDVILPALAHGLSKLRGDQSDCGRASAEASP